MYILPKLSLTPEIKLKYFRIGECIGIGQTTVVSIKLGPPVIAVLSHRPGRFSLGPFGLIAGMGCLGLILVCRFTLSIYLYILRHPHLSIFLHILTPEGDIGRVPVNQVLKRVS